QSHQCVRQREPPRLGTRGPLPVEDVVSRRTDRFREGIAVPVARESNPDGVLAPDDHQAVMNLEQLTLPRARAGDALPQGSAAWISHRRAEILHFEVRRMVAGRLIACALQPELRRDIATVCALRRFALVEPAVAGSKVVD